MRLTVNTCDIRSKADLLGHRILGSVYYGMVFGTAGMMLAALACMGLREVGADNNWIFATGGVLGATLGIILVWKNVFLSAPKGKNLEEELARLPMWASDAPRDP